MALRRRRFDRFFVLRDGVSEPVELSEPVSLAATEATDFVLVTEDRSGPETKRNARVVAGTRGSVMEAARQAAKDEADPNRLVIAARPRGLLEGETVYQEIAGFQMEPEGPTRASPTFQAHRAAPELVRHDTFQGRDHLVVPVVMLSEGVIWPSNAAAPELALASEYGNPAEAWNGRPVVYRHPQEGSGSANQRPIAERETIGQVFDAKLRDDGALVGELWIDLAKAEGVPGALEACRRIEAGERVEVSTGYFAEQEPASGVYQGRRYAAVQRSIKPDHLALLSTEETGACSWEDGCGCPRVNARPSSDGATCESCGGRLSASARDSARRPSFDVLRDEFDRNVEVEENVKRFLETFRIQARREDEPVTNQLSDEDLRTALMVALDRSGASPVFIVAVYDGQVVYAVDPGGFDPLKTVRRSFTQEGTSVSVGDDEEEVRPVTEFVPAAERRPGTGGESMDREQRIEALVASDASPLGEDDRAWLAHVPEERLALLESSASEPGSGAAPPPAPTPEQIDRETLRAAAERQGLEVREPEPAPQSEEEFLRRAPPAMRSFLSNAVAHERDRRESMIRALVENGRHGMNEEQIRALEPSVLESLARMAEVPDYSLRGQPRDPEPTPERFAPEPPSVFDRSGASQ